MAEAADAAHLMKELNGPLSERCARSVVPLFEGNGGYPVQVGTGTLFAVADARFLVTAAHVAEDFAARRSVLLTCDVVAGRNLVPIDWDWDLAHGDFDVAVFRLGSSAVAAMSGLTFLRLNEVDLSPGPKPGLFYVYGFPRAWWKADGKTDTVAVSPTTLLCTPYSGSTHGWRYDERYHLAFEQVDDHELPGDERQNVPPSLKGISGCSVWHLREAESNPSGFHADQAKIVGIQTCTRERDSIIQATRWMAAVVLIEKNCPDLAAALALHVEDEPALVVPARR